MTLQVFEWRSLLYSRPGMHACSCLSRREQSGPAIEQTGRGQRRGGGFRPQRWQPGAVSQPQASAHRLPQRRQQRRQQRPAQCALCCADRGAQRAAAPLLPAGGSIFLPIVEHAVHIHCCPFDACLALSPVTCRDDKVRRDICRLGMGQKLGQGCRPEDEQQTPQGAILLLTAMRARSLPSRGWLKPCGHPYGRLAREHLGRMLWTWSFSMLSEFLIAMRPDSVARHRSTYCSANCKPRLLLTML